MRPHLGTGSPALFDQLLCPGERTEPYPWPVPWSFLRQSFLGRGIWSQFWNSCSLLWHPPPTDRSFDFLAFVWPETPVPCHCRHTHAKDRLLSERHSMRAHALTHQMEETTCCPQGFALDGTRILVRWMYPDDGWWTVCHQSWCEIVSWVGDGKTEAMSLLDRGLGMSERGSTRLEYQTRGLCLRVYLYASTCIHIHMEAKWNPPGEQHCQSHTQGSPVLRTPTQIGQETTASHQR